MGMMAFHPNATRNLKVKTLEYLKNATWAAYWAAFQNWEKHKEILATDLENWKDYPDSSVVKWSRKFCNNAHDHMVRMERAYSKLSDLYYDI